MAKQYQARYLYIYYLCVYNVIFIDSDRHNLVRGPTSSQQSIGFDNMLNTWSNLNTFACRSSLHAVTGCLAAAA